MFDFRCKSETFEMLDAPKFCLLFDFKLLQKDKK